MTSPLYEGQGQVEASLSEAEPLTRTVPVPLECRAPTGYDGRPVLGRPNGPERPHFGQLLGLADCEGVDELTLAALDGRLILPGTKVGPEPNKLNSKHLAVLRLAAQGYRPREISRYLSTLGAKLSPERVAMILRSRAGKAILARMLAKASENLDTAKILQAAAPEAALHTIDIMRTADSSAIKLRAAEAVLNRAGFGPKSTVEVTPPPLASADAQVLQELTSALREATALRRKRNVGSEIEVAPTSSPAELPTAVPERPPSGAPQLPARTP